MQFTQGSPQKIGVSKRPASSYAEMHSQQRLPSSCQLEKFTNILRFQQSSQPLRKQVENQFLAINKQSTKKRDTKSEQQAVASETVGQQLPSSSLNAPLVESNVELASGGEFKFQNGKRNGSHQMKLEINGNDSEKRSSLRNKIEQNPQCSRQNFPFSSRASLQQHELIQVQAPQEEYYHELKQDIAQVRENNKTSSWNYQNAILEHELYRSRQQTTYTAEQPEHLKREIMNRIEMRHREELHSLQVAWEKEKAILSRTVNLQKLRLLDNARIMLQMEGDLARVKQLGQNNQIALKDAIKPSIIVSSPDLNSASMKRNNSKISNTASANSIQKMKPKDELITKNLEQSLEQASPLISISSKKASSTILSFHKRNASTAVSTPNPIHHKRFSSNASDLSTSIFPFSTTVKHVRSSKGSESNLNNNKDDILVSPSKTNDPPAPALLTKQLIKAIFFPSQKIVGSHLTKSKSCSSKKFPQSINTSKQMNTFSIQAAQKCQKKKSIGNITSPHQVSSDKVSFSRDQYSIYKQISSITVADKHGRAERSSKSITDQSTNSVKIINKTEKKRVGQSLDIFKKFQTNLRLFD